MDTLKIDSSMKKMLVTGVIFIIVSIVLGAFGAHALKSHLSADRLASFETGVKYQMYHGLGLLLLAILTKHIQLSWERIRIVLTIGVLFFSGSIYLLALQPLLGVKYGAFIGPITPIGGLFLMIGWGFVLKGLLTTKTWIQD
jgi:uncharacterized membrane protein YgdD (TMEM256/DUF423 family)